MHKIIWAGGRGRWSAVEAGGGSESGVRQQRESHLLERLQDLLHVKVGTETLDGGQRLAATALLHADVDLVAAIVTITDVLECV